MLHFTKGNSQYFRITGFKDNSTTPATYVNDAVLHATLRETSRTGTNVPGATDMVGQYQVGTNGEYRFPIDAVSFNPTPGKYVLIASGQDSLGNLYEAEEMVEVTIRDFSA